MLLGRAPRDTEVGTDDASLIVRSIPLRAAGERVGALVLLRDVTDLRRRDRELVTKDATIREIHHRVKNNLQTVAALLRLQARRIEEPAAKLALEEAVRRVGSIAIVHEILSQSVEENVEFDEIADRLGRMVTEVSALGERVKVRRTGSFGVLPSERATALAMVLTEVLQNAVEHGYDADAETPGIIVVSVRRLVGRLHLTVEDDGRGLPEDFDPERSHPPRSLDRPHAGRVRARRAAGDRRRARADGRPGLRGRAPGLAAGVAVEAQAEERTRARALRRFRARRSSSLSPPHTPWS